MLDEHAKVLAFRLALTESQREILVSELRNALVPGSISEKYAQRGIQRVLALADAIAREGKHG